MAAKSGYGEKFISADDGDTGYNDRLIAELKGRVAVLENELAYHKRTEEALRAGEERYRGLVESTGDWIWETDQDFVLTYDSPRGREILGYEPGEVIGMTPFSFMPDDDLEKMKMIAWPAIMRHEPIQRIENRLIKKDGSMITIETSGMPLFDESGRYRGYRGVNHDITERKRAEDALRESEEKFKAIFSRAAVGIAITDHRGYILDCNPAYQEMLGYSKDELREKRFIEFTHPDDVERNLELQRQLSGGYIDKYQFEKRYIRKDGRVIWVWLTASAIRNPDGSLKHNLAVAEDITRRWQAEEELKAAKQRAELYLDLMSHDINNMHQVALGYLELAKSMPPGMDQETLLDKPVEVLQRSAKLIDNLRKLEKLRNKTLLVQDIDACEVVSDVQREYGHVPNKSVTLYMNGHEHCFVRADGLLREVFINLVGNAIKHTGDRANIIINLDVVENNGRYCRVAVEDDGPGITDDFKNIIFNRALKGTSKAKGMGLGLYLVKALVDSYGGRVWVEDRVKGDHTKGARFVVLLPAVDK